MQNGHPIPARREARRGGSRTKSADVHDFFSRFGQAVSRGEPDEAADLWDFPALVLADQGARALASRREIAQFYAAQKEHYAARGVAHTRAEVLRVERLSERMLQVLVRWPYFDEQGQERGSETTSYVLRADDAGELKVRLALIVADSRH